eukprot:scaffold80992_cov60-Phaeocystis_antarctica.AAC.1
MHRLGMLVFVVIFGRMVALVRIKGATRQRTTRTEIETDTFRHGLFDRNTRLVESPPRFGTSSTSFSSRATHSS